MHVNMHVPLAGHLPAPLGSGSRYHYSFPNGPIIGTLWDALAFH